MSKIEDVRIAQCTLAASAALIGASTAAMKPYVDLGKWTVGHAAKCPNFNFQS